MIRFSTSLKKIFDNEIKVFLITFSGWLLLLLFSGVFILFGFDEFGVKFSEFGSLFYVLAGLIFGIALRKKNSLLSKGLLKGILTIFLSWIVFIIIFIIFFILGFKLL